MGKMAKSGVNDWKTLDEQGNSTGANTQSGNTLDAKIKVLGSANYEVVITADNYNNGGTEITSNTSDFLSIYYVTDFISQFSNDISNTEADADNNSIIQTEYGFTVSFIGTQYNYNDGGTATGECAGERILFPFKYSPGSEYADINNSTIEWTVANLHTHPNFKSCTDVYPDYVGPSTDVDVPNSQGSKYPWAVYDYLPGAISIQFNSYPVKHVIDTSSRKQLYTNLNTTNFSKQSTTY